MLERTYEPNSITLNEYVNYSSVDSVRNTPEGVVVN